MHACGGEGLACLLLLKHFNVLRLVRKDKNSLSKIVFHVEGSINLFPLYCISIELAGTLKKIADSFKYHNSYLLKPSVFNAVSTIVVINDNLLSSIRESVLGFQYLGNNSLHYVNYIY